MEKQFPLNKPQSETSAQDQLSPTDLDEFLPWAAGKLGLRFNIVVTRKAQEAAPTPSSAYKVKKGVVTVGKSVSKVDNVGIVETKADSEFKSMFDDEIRDTINVTTIYDKEDYLIQILLEKNKHVYREFIILIKIVIDFHRTLRRITINQGIDQYVIYELGNLLRVSNITEVYLDGTFHIQANYALLLTESNNVQVLSLARCKLHDQAVQEIADKLHFPLPASNKLMMLNLSTNCLTNKSAKYLASALRTNRKLTYLNLAGNKISDDGGIAILNILLSFPLTLEEQNSFKQRYVDYLKHKNNVIQLHLEALKLQNAIPDKAKKLKKEKSAVNQKRKDDDDKNIDATLYEKAETLAVKNLGNFEDPFSDSTIINNFRYSNGNGTIAYLNLAYNNLTYFFLKTLVKVVQYQNNNKVKGLKNVQLDGNPLPQCMELALLDGYFDVGLSYAANKGSAYTKPKTVSKAKK